jgi:hypothetical protein
MEIAEGMQRETVLTRMGQERRSAVPERMKQSAVFSFMETKRGLRLFRTGILRIQPIKTINPRQIDRIAANLDTASNRPVFTLLFPDSSISFINMRITQKSKKARAISLYSWKNFG